MGERGNELDAVAMRRVACLFGAVVVLVGVGYASFTLTSPATAKSRNSSDLAALGAQSVDLVNQARATEGIHPLVRDSRLDGVAAAQAKRMVRAGALSHNLNLANDVGAMKLAFSRVGENVGSGRDSRSIHGAFMASPAHRANIERPGYNALGVAVVAGHDGAMFTAHVFAQRI